MTNKPIQTALNFLLRATGARGTATGRDEETALPGATSRDELNGARDVFAAAVDAMSPTLNGVEIGDANPAAVAIRGPNGLTPFHPRDEGGQTISVATKPWVFQADGDENQPTLVGTKPWLLHADGDEDQPVLISTKPCASYEEITLADAVHEVAQFAGGGKPQQGSVQQLIQAMAGFAPQVPGSGLTVFSEFQDGLDGILTTPSR